MTQEALKLALEALEVSTDWDVTATGKQLKSMQAITALRKALAQPEQERIAFAGVKIWVGDQQAMQLLTQTGLHHAIDPWGLVEHASGMCIASLKEMNT